MLTCSPSTLIKLAIDEDLAHGDITTDTLLRPSEQGQAAIRTRQSAIASGLEPAVMVFKTIDPSLEVTECVQDGDAVTPRQDLLVVKGSLASILKAERLALNFLQHLSGIATHTYLYVGAVSGLPVEVRHTRKTTPGLRQLEIAAVLHGGGDAHRSSLSESLLIKDNHIQAVGSITQAVQLIKDRLGPDTFVEVECDTPTQVEEALQAGASMILLDNMPLTTLKDMVALAKGKALLEASGGVTLKNIRAIAETGVNVISTSQITLGAPAVDIGLDFL